MTEKETAKLEKIKAYLDEKGISYKEHTEHAAKKYVKYNIKLLAYKIYIRLSDENDSTFMRFHRGNGKSFIILRPSQSPSSSLRSVIMALCKADKAHEEEKARRVLSYYSSSMF